MSVVSLFAAILYAILLSARVSQADSAAGNANGTIPAPVIIPPTQYWCDSISLRVSPSTLPNLSSIADCGRTSDREGNDGPWSSFQLRIGTPPQFPRVLISTTGYNSWVVLPQPGCNSSTLPCATSRGTLFDPDQSSTWRDQGLYALDLEQNLNYSTNANFGLDTVGFNLPGNSGPVLDSQVVAAFQNNVYYYLGLFGLAPFPTNFTTFGNPLPSFVTTLKAKNLIPSISWSYTAGAQYRLKQVYGSAIIGGYDRSRFIPNNLTFRFAPDISRDLVVGLQSITSTESNGKTASLLPSGILTFVDSTIPYIYLPAEACSVFEKQFGLSWDPTSQLYLVNDSLHQSLLARKLNFTFQLGDFATGGQNVNITLPYESFDLTADQPLVSNKSRYFPIKRAANETQYTLGRAFLQEAYLIADYERSNFSISQCQWQENLGQDIVAIRSINSTATTDPTPAPPSSLGTGAIVGIVVGAILLLVLAGLLAYALAKRKWPFKHVRKPRAEAGASGRDTDTMSDKAEMDAHLSERVEMESPYEGAKEMPGEMAGDTGLKYLPETPLGELQGSPTPPPDAHELLDPSMYNELPASPVPVDYFAGTKVPSRRPSRQSPLRRELSPETVSAGQDSLPISPLPSPIPSPPPLPGPNRTITTTPPAPTDAAAAGTDLHFPKPAPSPVPRTPSKPQQRPFQINLPHGSAPASPVASSSAPRPLPSIAVHAPELDEPPSENSTLQQTPARMKQMWKPADYSGEGYHSDGE